MHVEIHVRTAAIALAPAWSLIFTADGAEYMLGADSLVQDGVPTGTVTKRVLRTSRIYPGTEHDYWVYVPAQYDQTRPARA